MECIRSLIQGITLIPLTALMLFMQAGAVSARDAGCWADFWEYANYIGAHVHIQGPVKLSNLRDLESRNWESRMDSLVVGPSARLMLF